MNQPWMKYLTSDEFTRIVIAADGHDSPELRAARKNYLDGLAQDALNEATEPESTATVSEGK